MTTQPDHVDFDGKHVVITGGTGALGRAVVELLVTRGATVHVPCVEAMVPPALADRASSRLIATAAVDVSDEAAVARYYQALPALDASIHLAGGFAMAPLADTSLGDFRHMVALNAETCFLCCREAVRAMRAAGGGGRIVNVGARPAVQPTAGMIAYATAKGAVAWLTRCLAEETRADGILVNAVLPSVIDTPANRRAMPDADAGVWPKPEEIAETIAFLASDGNRLTSGALVPVYGRA